MIRIVKASAGSGKTFRLTKEYLRLLLGSPDPQEYRHILAVTFTNKATGEMKHRILKELDRLARSPERSPYHDDFVPSPYPDDTALSKAARQRLGAILHDYSCFSISTIDRFFQQTLKAFSREIGHFASYQVELDKPALVHESVDRILDNLSEGPEHGPMIDWLVGSVRDGLSRGDGFNLDNLLYNMAVSLESESYRELIRRSGLDEENLYSQENLRALIRTCRRIVSSFNGEVSRLSQNALDLLLQRGVAAKDLSSPLRKLISLAETRPDDSVEMLTDAFFNDAGEPDKWFLKKASKAAQDAVGNDFQPLLDAVTAFFSDTRRFQVYRTALMLRRQLYALGIAGEIRRSFTDLLQEKNVLSLDDSNALLRDIIDGSDAPFIYEKIGVRYRHFLLDEFQDTSIVQWNNFLPLLRESLSSGGRDLVVGDVKQSIYRFRDSDWRLLDREIGIEFPGEQSKQETLGSNFRTFPRIVRTNGDFFRFAADQLDRMHEEDDGIIRRLYSDVGQTPCAKAPSDEAGTVGAVFCDSVEQEYDEILRQVRAHGAANPDGYGEIAILVRGKKEGSEIASRLISTGIPVISDDALFVKSSVTVRRLVSQLSLMVSREEIEDDGKRQLSVSGFLARQMGFTPPESYQSPLELAECLLRGLQRCDSALFNAEIAYIEAFMDNLSEWCSRNGNDLAAFLTYWKDADPRINPPEEGRSVRIMTIHKSKGLEFPLVILPFIENTVLFKPESRWCLPDTEGTELEGVARGAYWVNLSAQTPNTLFASDYTKEYLMQLIDNLNVLYVAMTRPKQALSLIALQPSDDFKKALPRIELKPLLEAIKKGNAPEGGPLVPWSDMRELLYAFVTAEGSGFATEPPVDEGDAAWRFRSGELILPLLQEKERETAAMIPAPYPSFPLNDEQDQLVGEDGEPLPIGERNRLKFNSGAADYFGEDGAVGMDASARVRGTVLHEILARVVTPEDLQDSIRRAIQKGLLPLDRREEVEQLLGSAIASLEGRRKADWFPPEGAGCKVLNETSVISTGGDVFRPDRVVVHPGGRVWIVDYKFGRPESAEIKKYLRQIDRYAALLRSMGYAEVSSALWYPLEAPGTDVIEGRSY